jgi:TPR repeat protein
MNERPHHLAKALIGIVCGGVAVAYGLSILQGSASSSQAASDLCSSAADCEQRCAPDHAPDCTRAGLAYLLGEGVVRSPQKALGLLRKACDGGDPPGCTALGAALLENPEGSPDTSAAVAALEKACRGGDAMGCNNLANLYAGGEGVARDVTRAQAMYLEACDKGSGMACSTLAKALLAGDGAPPDPARAEALFARSVTLLQSGCDGGSGRACGQVGWLYERGYGCVKDASKASRSYELGCDRQDAPSCYNLATIRRAAGTDPATVSRLFQRACSLGLPQACSEAVH